MSARRDNRWREREQQAGAEYSPSLLLKLACVCAGTSPAIVATYRRWSTRNADQVGRNRSAYLTMTSRGHTPFSQPVSSRRADAISKFRGVQVVRQCVVVSPSSISYSTPPHIAAAPLVFLLCPNGQFLHQISFPWILAPYPKLAKIE